MTKCFSPLFVIVCKIQPVINTIRIAEGKINCYLQQGKSRKKSCRRKIVALNVEYVAVLSLLANSGKTEHVEENFWCQTVGRVKGERERGKRIYGANIKTRSYTGDALPMRAGKRVCHCKNLAPKCRAISYTGDILLDKKWIRTSNFLLPTNYPPVGQISGDIT